MSFLIDVLLLVVLGVILGCLLAGWPFYPL